MTGEDLFKAMNPQLEEWTAGYVLLAFMPQEDGTTIRTVIVNGNNNNPETIIALKPALVAAAAWKNGALSC